MSSDSLQTKSLIKIALALLATLLLIFAAVKAGQGIANQIMAQTADTQTTEPLSAAEKTTTGSGSMVFSRTAEITTVQEATQATTAAYATDTEYVGITVNYTRMPSHRIYTLEDFGITRYVSEYDANGDGIDDQTQLLEGAKAFLAKNPKYDSHSYFSTGYPEVQADGSWVGVCCDVINMAFLEAGYNLRDLIEADIAAHPDWYAGRIDEKQINFRRVKNQLYFFQHHAESLTLDIRDLDAWQPGDIVVFGDVAASNTHIAIVSDRRAEDGVAYVLHLASTGQTNFEEDYLTTTTKAIIGHFRYNGYNGE